MTATDVECFLCRAVADGTRPWYDAILWRDETSIMLPGTGGLSPGYVLVAPLAHHSSLLQAAERDPAIPGSVSAAVRHAVSVIGPSTYWEHGGPPTPRRSSACVDHAHLHVAPGRLGLTIPTASCQYATIDEALTSSARNGGMDSYLLLGWSPGRCHVGADIHVSQHFRREWARVLGEPHRWDYALVEDSTTTRQTISLFRSTGHGGGA